MYRSFVFAVFASLVVACSSSSTSPGDQPGKASTDPTHHEGESEESKQQEKDPTTVIVVGVDAESFQSQGFHLGLVDIVAKVDGLVAAKETRFPSEAPMFPHELRLEAPNGKPDALVEIEVVGRDRPDPTYPAIVTRRATTHFVKGTTKLAYVYLEVRCNTFGVLGGSGVSGPTCNAPTTCVAGRCVPSELPALGDYRADWTTNPPSACGTGAPELVIGQGQSELASLAEDETVTLEEGPQCGHHLWLALRMKNLAQSGTTTTVSATQPGTAITVPATAYPYTWGPSEAGACDLVGVRFQLDVGGAPASEFLGKPLDVKVELKDKAGHTATATRHVNVASVMKVIPGRNCGSGPNR
jgi:hypothetical protein